MTAHQQTFDALRPYAFGVAYRLVGSVSDAEDIVQEAWLRWRRVGADEIREPKAWLTTVVTRLGIDHLRSAQARRETYVGPWLPEPMVTDAGPPLFQDEAPPSPEDKMVLAQDVSMALLVVLEQLAPEERAAFLLHDAFDYGYGELSEMLGKSESACRQMVSRARKRVRGDRPRFDADAATHERLAKAFETALQNEDPQALIDILAEDVVTYTDGGGKAIAALNPIYGADNVARFFIGIHGKAPPNLALDITTVNGLPGFVATLPGEIYLTMSFAVEDGRIKEIYAMRNPEKMRHLSAATH